MTVLLVEPLKAPRVWEMEESLSAMQKAVGGTIQVIYPFEDPTVALVCNDDGKLLGLPLNRGLFHPETGELYDILAGTFFLCAAPPESEHFASLTPEQLEQYIQRFRRIELYLGNLG